jgi:NitT/TauT family transport system ATP-binding protein
MAERRGRLRLERVTKRIGPDFASKTVVQDCSFTVESGKFTVLIGPSGCGKTTLINLIAGYDLANSGAIALDDIAVRAPGLERLVVFQETALFPWMTTLDNVMYGPLVQRQRPREEIEKAAVDLLRRVGLSEFLSKYPMQLSGGMQRRAELARALINDPRLLLMDEPFRGLDALTRELMQEYLLELFEERGGTVFFVTSEIDEAIFLADQIIVLSSSPATVKAVIGVDLPRPRKRAMVLASPQYSALKKTALDLLYAEAAGAFAGRHAATPALEEGR